jgi:FG-GAP-like repeat
MNSLWQRTLAKRLARFFTAPPTRPSLARRTVPLQVEQLEDRTTPTTLLSVTPSPAIINDLDAPSTFSLKLVFSGQMNTAFFPAISFPTAGENPGSILSPASGSFTTTTIFDDTFVATYNVIEQDVSMPHIDVQVSGARDFSNALVPPQTVTNDFAISTLNPTVRSLVVNKPLITASDAGSIFTVTVTYAEPMNTAIVPTIAFNQNVSSTLTFTTSSWNGAGTIYTANYSIANGNVAIPSINMSVTGAQDPDGFKQNNFGQVNAFSINTQTIGSAAFPVGSSVQVSGDFNGDGLADVAAYYPSTGQWLVALSTGHSFLPAQVWSTFGTRTGWTAQITGDFTGDGKTDIANFYNANGAAMWFVSVSTGSSFTTTLWADFGSTLTPTGWTYQLVGDFNGDGKTDIASFLYSPGSYARWWVSTSNGSSFTTTSWADLGNTLSASNWAKPVVGDFNHDGKADIANFLYAPGYYARWWVSASNGSSFTTTSFGGPPTATGWTTSLVGDFNGDGNADLATYNTNGQWWVSLSNGTSFTTTLWASLNPATTVVQAAGDFNHDGKTDLSSLSLSSGQLNVLASTGTNFAISLWGGLSSTTALTSLFVGDFSGDGIPDIAFFLSNPNTGVAQWMVSVSNGNSFTTTRWR